ncbi:MAG: hypothetical protein AAFY26_01015 [Cyanobacteria bacterium J06638_22]
MINPWVQESRGSRQMPHTHASRAHLNDIDDFKKFCAKEQYQSITFCQNSIKVSSILEGLLTIHGLLSSVNGTTESINTGSE